MGPLHLLGKHGYWGLRSKWNRATHWRANLDCKARGVRPLVKRAKNSMLEKSHVDPSGQPPFGNAVPSIFVRNVIDGFSVFFRGTSATTVEKAQGQIGKLAGSSMPEVKTKRYRMVG